MKKYIDMYGNNLLSIFSKKQLKNENGLLVVKEGTKIIDSGVKTCYYNEDFESLLNYTVPTKNRKTKQMLSLQESVILLERLAYGVLSFSYQDIPYGIGINHIYKDGKIYFHTGKNGYKLHAINQRVNYVVIEDLGINEGMATHNHTSIMALGMLHKLDNLDTKKEVLELLMQRLAPTNDKVINEAAVLNTTILELDIEYIHGKTHVR